MFGTGFQLNEQSLPVVQEIGKHMPGGFFIYKAAPPEEMLYVYKTAAYRQTMRCSWPGSTTGRQRLFS